MDMLKVQIFKKLFFFYTLDGIGSCSYYNILESDKVFLLINYFLLIIYDSCNFPHLHQESFSIVWQNMFL